MCASERAARKAASGMHFTCNTTAHLYSSRCPGLLPKRSPRNRRMRDKLSIMRRIREISIGVLPHRPIPAAAASSSARRYAPGHNAQCGPAMPQGY